MKKLLFALLMLLGISSITQAQTIAYEWDAAADTTKLPSTKKFNRAVLKGEAILVKTSAIVKGTYFAAGDIIYAKKTRPTLVADFADIEGSNLPYNVFIAKISQSGTSAPVMTILSNEINFPSFSLTRSSAGIYTTASFINKEFDLTKYTLTFETGDHRISGSNGLLQARLELAFSTNHTITIENKAIASNGDLTAYDLNKSVYFVIKKYN